MNKWSILLTIGPVLAMLLGATEAAKAFADNQARFDHGWNDGQTAAINDWLSQQYTVDSGGNAYCDNSHSHTYCKGYYAGYQDEWQRSADKHWQIIDQQQSSSINIRGNNNDVQVNQGEAANSGNGGYGSSSGANPRCLVICAIIH